MSKRTRLLSKLKHVYSHNAKLVLDVSNDDIGLIIEALETKIELNKRNMTPDIIKEYMIFEDECIQKDFTFKSLLEARAKQIAKKPTDVTPSYSDSKIYECFVCGALYGYGQGKLNYCSECGNRFDWSENDE